ncbi:MAG: hypothetical protein ACRELS_08500 [Candidatus Rokuibacteriota bacterium]
MMVAKEPKNEQRICKAVMSLLAHRRGERIISAQPVDAVVRDRAAVEWVFDTPTAKFAVEHTRIEIFSNQIGEGKLFAQLLAPLESELAGKLPGAFFLIVDVGAAKAPSTEHAEIRRILAEWILAKGTELEPEEQSGPDGKCDITERPTGVPFEVTLHRDADYDSRLFIIQNLVEDLQSLQRDRIRTALARKCPKLGRRAKTVVSPYSSSNLMMLRSPTDALSPTPQWRSFRRAMTHPTS